MQPSAVTSPREKCRVEAVRWPISNSATGEGALAMVYIVDGMVLSHEEWLKLVASR